MRPPFAVYVAAVAAAFATSTAVTWLVSRDNNTLAGFLDAALSAVAVGGIELWAWRRRRRSAGGEVHGGTLTFLFTDIERSTALLKELGEGYGDALADHERLIRTSFEARGGRIIDTQGDATFAVYRRVGDAVLAAIDAQRAIATHAWPGGVTVRVRMGIHTGQATVRSDRLIGLAIHRAARICAAANGGQILVSQATRQLLEDEDAPMEVGFADLGEHSLKDLDRPVRLSAISAPGLEEVGRPPRVVGLSEARMGADRVEELQRAARAAASDLER